MVVPLVKQTPMAWTVLSFRSGWLGHSCAVLLFCDAERSIDLGHPAPIGCLLVIRYSLAVGLVFRFRFRFSLLAAASPHTPLSDHVLGEFSRSEKKDLESMIADACDAVEHWIEEDDVQKVMTRWNGR